MKSYYLGAAGGSLTTIGFISLIEGKIISGLVLVALAFIPAFYDAYLHPTRHAR